MSSDRLLLPLELWLERKSHDVTCFPTGKNYFNRYMQLKEHLETNYYPHIGAALGSTDGLVFTSHNKDHFDKVIMLAGELLGLTNSDVDGSEAIGIEPYESFILLCGILLHDAGNIYGRVGHEKNAFKIFTEASDREADRTELKAIARIAEAHGGHTKKVEDPKDTIGALPHEETEYLGKKYRPKLLAGILRFADEICEDRTRAAIPLLNSGDLGGAEVFHKYALSISSVHFDKNDKSVVIKFVVEKSDVMKTFKKNSDDVYLIDEITNRLDKMNAERVYCTRHTSEILQIRKIRATIDIVDESSFEEVIEPISILLEDSGYPSNVMTVSKVCPELTGVKIKDELSGM